MEWNWRLMGSNSEVMPSGGILPHRKPQIPVAGRMGHPALMRACTMIGILALLAGVACCEQNAPLTSETFVGTYVYYSANKGQPHSPDELTLRADGTYILVYKAIWLRGTTKEGRWWLDKDPRPSIVLDHAGYPVRIKGRSIRLVISDDSGHSYQKIE